MYKIFVELLEKKGIKTSAVAAATGISNMTFSDWKNGKSTPKADKLQKIADYFGVTVDYLITGKDNTPHTIAAHFDGDEYTEEELDKIKEFAAFVKNKRNK